MKLTQEGLEALIESDLYFRDGTLTICVLKLKSGAQVVGESNVIDPENYDRSLGKKYARERAVNKLYELEGYAVKTRGPK